MIENSNEVVPEESYSGKASRGLDGTTIQCQMLPHRETDNGKTGTNLKGEMEMQLRDPVLQNLGEPAGDSAEDAFTEQPTVSEAFLYDTEAEPPKSKPESKPDYCFKVTLS